MHGLLIAALAFLCGSFVGFFAAALSMFASRTTEADDDFDGGFRISNAPAVKTKIWSDSVKAGSKE